MRRLWLALLILPLCAFDTDGIFNTRGYFSVAGSTGVGGGSYTAYAADAVDHMYLNSSEIGCTRSTTTDSDVVLCDDFQDGDWYRCGADDVFANGGDFTTQDGWVGTIYTNYGGAGCQWTPASGDGPEFYGAVTGGGVGVGGVTYAADQGNAPGGSSTAVGHMADHNLGPTTATAYDELWIRFYIKYSPNFDIRGNYKLMTINNKTAGFGGIWVGGMGAGAGDALAMCPVYDCSNLGYTNPQGGDAYLVHNVSSYDFDAHGGNWTKVEIHIALESTPGTQDGVWQMWVDDCGSDGLSCPVSPTLRADYDNVRWRCPSGGCADSSNIDSIWLEAQWDPSGGNVAFGDYTRFNFLRVEVNRTTPIGAVQIPN